MIDRKLKKPQKSRYFGVYWSGVPPRPSQFAGHKCNLCIFTRRGSVIKHTHEGQSYMLY